MTEIYWSQLISLVNLTEKTMNIVPIEICIWNIQEFQWGKNFNRFCQRVDAFLWNPDRRDTQSRQLGNVLRLVRYWLENAIKLYIFADYYRIFDLEFLDESDAVAIEEVLGHARDR